MFLNKHFSATNKIFILITITLLFSCFPYIYYNQNEVLIKGIDIDKTLDIAVIELKEGGFDSILTIWAIRDQIITPLQAKRINDIYLEYKDKIVYENEELLDNLLDYLSSMVIKYDPPRIIYQEQIEKGQKKLIKSLSKLKVSSNDLNFLLNIKKKLLF